MLILLEDKALLNTYFQETKYREMFMISLILKCLIYLWNEAILMACFFDVVENPKTNLWKFQHDTYNYILAPTFVEEYRTSPSCTMAYPGSFTQ